MARRMYRNAQKGIADPDFDAAALETLHHSTITISGLEMLDFVKRGGSAEPCPTPEADAQVGSSASSRINVADTSSLGLPEARIRIACSKGTYIRAFARDLGEALGTGAHLGGLIRTKTGTFCLEEALSLQEALSLLAE
ncbi:MAG: hypothetical protein IKN06_10360 [Bacteroidales bacterium]|nr:hypothetical protein [Bacteroidales bacterium]